MGVDQAYEEFKAIRQTLPPEDDLPITDNEACTRVHLIDPILTRVLGWPLERMAVEAAGGEASHDAPTHRQREGRVDYVVRDHDGACWFVIEAKKRSKPLLSPLHTTPGFQVLKLTGPVLKECWPIIDVQMTSYLGKYMPCFGAVTTGEQWVGFLGTLRPANVLLDSTSAIVFRSLDDIEKDFELFYETFGIEGAQQRSLLHRLSPVVVRGLVRAPQARRVVPPGAERPVDYQGAKDFHNDLRQAMDAAFGPIRTDRNALAACFVESRESRDASSRLERMANELGAALRSAVDHYQPAVEGEVDAVTAPNVDIDEFRSGDGYIARLLGEKSSGKTVFLRRLFDLQLMSRRDRVVLLWLDAEHLAPFDPALASRRMLEQIRKELFGDEGPSWEQFREVYHREWKQQVRLVGLTDQEVSPEMRQGFVRLQQETEARDPEDALRRYAEFSTRTCGRLLCLVVDNIDHLEHPEHVVEWAVARHLSMFAMTTVAMEDATLWRLRRRGSDQLGDHQPEQFWLPRPEVREVVKNRCEYLRKLLEGAPPGTARTKTTLGRRGQWRWSVSAEDLVRVVSTVLLEQEDIAQWIGQLCNYDLREVLDVCQQIVLSPHVRAEGLLTMQTVQKLSRGRVLRTLIAPKSEQFMPMPTGRVINVFGHWIGPDFAPLLPARILALLRAREDEDRNHREPFPGFIAVFELLELFERATAVRRAATLETLHYLSTMRIVEPFNPADQAFKDPDARLKITPRGKLHLDWALREPTYVRLMAEVDPIVTDSAYRDLLRRWQAFLDVLKPGREIEAWQLERGVAGAYVGYLLEQADTSSPLVGSDEVEPLRSFERDVRRAWPSATLSIPQQPPPISRE
ncbi:hypothetical protein [Chondromyces apiculatus]|uniref:Uncharacterized protein n=1 Tax=Chondromyces apiculatus DSM 436 TaxID=1192034 RepID=A0A017TEV8_9BACT|nr:hypothetical protein [Chondromyces apiculatus]EYF07833.1 Hypothetical protein CAP_6855 [Chondromyces apiculatus DSM 436]